VEHTAGFKKLEICKELCLGNLLEPDLWEVKNNVRDINIYFKEIMKKLAVFYHGIGY
jgi:hypothetical protein